MTTDDQLDPRLLGFQHQAHRQRIGGLDFLEPRKLPAIQAASGGIERDLAGAEEPLAGADGLAVGSHGRRRLGRLDDLFA